jgi:hypothetical protein
MAWTSPMVIGGFIVAIAAFIAFIFTEQRVKEPIIPLTLFRNRTFSTVVGILFMQGIAMFGAIMYMPLFMQAVMGQSASASGRLMTPMVIAMTVEHCGGAIDLPLWAHQALSQHRHRAAGCDWFVANNTDPDLKSSLDHSLSTADGDCVGYGHARYDPGGTSVG